MPRLPLGPRQTFSSANLQSELKIQSLLSGRWMDRWPALQAAWFQYHCCPLVFGKSQAAQNLGYKLTKMMMLIITITAFYFVIQQTFWSTCYLPGKVNYMELRRWLVLWRKIKPRDRKYPRVSGQVNGFNKGIRKTQTEKVVFEQNDICRRLREWTWIHPGLELAAEETTIIPKMKMWQSYWRNDKKASVAATGSGTETRRWDKGQLSALRVPCGSHGSC